VLGSVKRATRLGESAPQIPPVTPDTMKSAFFLATEVLDGGEAYHPITTLSSRLVTGKGHCNVVGRRRRGAGRASSGPGVGLGWSAERWRQVGGRGERTHGP